MREIALHYFPTNCFGIEREIVFGVTYVLSVQYSCAVVSVFFVVARKLILFEYLTVTIVFQKYRKLSLKKKMIPYKTYVQEGQLFLALYGSTTIQSGLFLKNIENFV